MKPKRRADWGAEVSAHSSIRENPNTSLSRSIELLFCFVLFWFYSIVMSGIKLVTR